MSKLFQFSSVALFFAFISAVAVPPVFAQSNPEIFRSSCYRVEKEVYENGQEVVKSRAYGAWKECQLYFADLLTTNTAPVNKNSCQSPASLITSGVDVGGCRCPNGIVIDKGQDCGSQTLAQQRIDAKCTPGQYQCIDEKTEARCNAAGTKLVPRTCPVDSECFSSSCVDINNKRCQPGECIKNVLCSSQGILGTERCGVTNSCGNTREGECSSDRALCQNGVLLNNHPRCTRVDFEKSACKPGEFKKCDGNTQVEKVCSPDGLGYEVRACAVDEECRGSSCVSVKENTPGACTPGVCVNNTFCNINGEFTNISCGHKEGCGGDNIGEIVTEFACTISRRRCVGGELLDASASNCPSVVTCSHPGQCIDNQLCVASGAPPTKASCIAQVMPEVGKQCTEGETYVCNKDVSSNPDSNVLLACDANKRSYSLFPPRGNAVCNNGAWELDSRGTSDTCDPQSGTTCIADGTMVQSCGTDGKPKFTVCPYTTRCAPGVGRCMEPIGEGGSRVIGQDIVKCDLDQPDVIAATDANGFNFKIKCNPGLTCAGGQCVSGEAVVPADTCNRSNANKCINGLLCGRDGIQTSYDCVSSSPSEVCNDGTPFGKCNAQGLRCLSGQLIGGADGFCPGYEIAAAPTGPTPFACQPGSCRGIENLESTAEYCTANGSWELAAGRCGTTPKEQYAFVDNKGTRNDPSDDICMCKGDVNYPCRNPLMQECRDLPTSQAIAEMPYNSELSNICDTKFVSQYSYIHTCKPGGNYDDRVQLDGAVDVVNVVSLLGGDVSINEVVDYLPESDRANPTKNFLEGRGYEVETVFTNPNPSVPLGQISEDGTALLRGTLDAGVPVIAYGSIVNAEGNKESNGFVITRYEVVDGKSVFYGYDSGRLAGTDINTTEHAFEIPLNDRGIGNAQAVTLPEGTSP